MPHSAQTILIAGGGIAGLTLAVSLKQALGAGVQIAVYDPALSERAGERRVAEAQLRVSALAADGRRLLDQLGVWAQVSPEAQPITEMEITDSALPDPVRTRLLDLVGDVAPGEPLAHMVRNDDLIRALLATAKGLGVACQTQQVDRWICSNASTSGQGTARLSDGSQRQADLLIAADGARSRLRELAGIGWYGWGYNQSAIVATIAHDRPHLGKASQHFLPSGPFAILPLTGNRSSIVWSEATSNIPALMAMDADDLLLEIGQRFGLERGSIRLETFPVGVFPLGIGIAQRFHGRGLALVGDAAHLIHPIAGQGLNLGLRDVRDLGDALAEAIRIGLPAGDDNVLRGYDRRRRPDVLAMAMATDGLNRLFSTSLPPLRLLRNLGSRIVDRSPALKRLLMREAAGSNTQVD